MISRRTECGIMLVGLILSFCIHGCSTWTGGDLPTPKPSEETNLTPRPARTDSKGGLMPLKQADQSDRAPDQH